jgi:hypothetical protein
MVPLSAFDAIPAPGIYHASRRGFFQRRLSWAGPFLKLEGLRPYLQPSACQQKPKSSEKNPGNSVRRQSLLPKKGC